MKKIFTQIPVMMITFLQVIAPKCIPRLYHNILVYIFQVTESDVEELSNEAEQISSNESDDCRTKLFQKEKTSLKKE
jgi:hypothetical protein